MERQLAEIKSLALKYSKQQLGRMVQMGTLEPQKAMMAGMMIDRVQKQNAEPPQATVMQEVLGLSPMAAAQQSQPQMAPQMAPQGAPAPQPPMMAAAGGLLNIPAGDVGNYAGGGIVAFDDGGEVEGYAKGDLVPSGLFEALVQTESRGKHSAVSPKGARGASQLMPGTMRDPGYGIKPVRDESLEENLRVGREYLGAMLNKYKGNVDYALAAYNWGPGNVDKWLRRGGNPDELPKETKAYIPKIKMLMAQGQPEPTRMAAKSRESTPSAASDAPVGLPAILRRPLEKITSMLPSAGAREMDEIPMDAPAGYARGGIASFAPGGLNIPSDMQTPFDTSGGSNTVYGTTTTEAFRPRAPEEETSSVFGRGVRAAGSAIADAFSGLPGASEKYATQQQLLERQRALRARLQQLEGYGFRQQTRAEQAEAERVRRELDNLENQIKTTAKTPLADTKPPVEGGKRKQVGYPMTSGATEYVTEDQFPLQSAAEMGARRKEGRGAPVAPPTPDVAPTPAPTPEAPGVTEPVLGGLTFDQYRQLATPKVEGFDVTRTKELKDITAERMGAEEQAGVDSDFFGKLISGIEEKKGAAADDKDVALGHAIMQASFKLMGARRGQEFQALSEGAQEGLKGLQSAMKDIRTRQEKYDERIETLRLADQQARRTGLASDIARRDRLEDLARADQAKLAEMKNQAANVGVQAATTLTANDKSTLTQKYGIDVSAKTSRYVADLQAQTSREYTAALKEQQIEASKAKILVDAAGDYIAKNAANPKYLKDPAQLQNDAVAYANSIGAQFGVLPRGASSAPPTKPTAATYEKQYGLPPTNLR